MWCDRLVRGLAQHEFEVYALGRDPGQQAGGWGDLPRNVGWVRTAPLWGEPVRRPGGRGGRRQRRRFAEHFGELAEAISAPYGSGAPGRTTVQADRFANALHGLADLAGEHGGLSAALRSEDAVRTLERACRTLGAPHGAQRARVADLLTVTEALERALRPLSLDWYGGGAGGDPGLSGVDLCHAATGGAAVLPGLLAKRRFGTPLLLTEYGVRLRECYLAGAAGAAGGRPLPGPVRTLLAAFHGLLAAEAYARADLITPGNTHTRRWQERCGAERERLRTVYPGMDAARFAEVGERGAAQPGDDRTLVWVGRIEPPKDVIALLHAFAEVRRWQPDARLRIIETRRGEDPEADGYPAHCRALADHLFPDEAADAHSTGDNPVSFERLGDPEVPALADAYGAGGVVVLSSVVEGFPVGLVEAMFCGRATVSTDVGAVCEVIGGTGLVVPPRNPRALADACLALLSDAERCARLGAAARARALELFTVEQNVAAFRGIYLELMSHCPVRREEVGAGGGPLPFARPAEAHVPGRWTAGRDGDGFGHWLPGPAAARPAPEHTPTWASPPPPEPLGVGPRPSEEGA
ncbi:transferase [Streptomyces malaysiensis subsp. malaysiensis]|nr:transferase [Streptomyces malaysiensis]